MSSSELSYYFLRFAALLLFAFPFLMAYFVAVGGVPLDQGVAGPFWTITRLCLACLLAPLLGWVIVRQFSIVECSASGIVVYRRDDWSRFDWSEVAGVIKVPLTTPPLYRITFRTGDPPAYCIMSMFLFVSVGFWSFDLSRFLDYAWARIRAAERSSGSPDPADSTESQWGMNARAP